MDDFIAMAAAILLSRVKDPTKRTEIKAVCLKIFKTLKATYAGDPDFQ
jgi:hypothetical protein